MEWHKIKNILIAALVLTNMLFGCMLVFDNYEVQIKEDDSLFNETINILENNGILLNDSVKIPEIEKEMPVLTLSYDKNNGDYSYDKGDKVKKSISKKNAIEKANNMIGKLDIDLKNKNELKLENIYENADSMIYDIKYCNYYENNKIEDSYINIQVSSRGIENVKRNLSVAEASGKSKQKIISLTTALLRYMNEVSTNDSGEEKEIIDISIVYKIDSPYEGNATTDTAFPMWKIISSDKKVVYISAFN